MSTCTIFAGGAMASTDFIDVSAVRESDLIICADSGMRYAEKLGIKPDIVLGDFDSWDGELPDGAEIHRCPPEKDDTDTMLAVKTAIERGCSRIVLYGAMGARFDHTIANVQTLVYAHEHGCRMVILDDGNEMQLQSTGTVSYERRDGWYFSVLSLTEETIVGSLRGVRYPLTNARLTIGFPLGVSNEITGSEAVLRIDSGLALIVRAKM